MKNIPHNKPFIPKKSYKSIKKVLKSGWINYGSISHDTEKLLCDILNIRSESVLVTNGTSALFLALKALKIKKGDEVIVPTYTCTALLNAIYMTQALPIVVDISLDNLGISYSNIQKALSKKTKAILAVHTYGIPTDIKRLKKYNIPIIEDCAQALGSRYTNSKQKCGTIADLSIYSFYASKMITGGIGGAVVSQNKEYISYIKDYILFDNPHRYEPKFNFQISDINASMIYSGLQELSKLLKKRKKVSKYYNSIINNKKIIKYNIISGNNHYRYLLFFDDIQKKKECQKKMLSKGIRTIVPTKSKELLHNYMKLNKKNYKNAEYIAPRLLSIPIYYTLNSKDIKYISKAINDCLSTPTGI